MTCEPHQPHTKMSTIVATSRPRTLGNAQALKPYITAAALITAALILAYLFGKQSNSEAVTGCHLANVRLTLEGLPRVNCG